MSKGTINKVMLIGRLGLPPETRQATTGMAISHLSLATNETYKDKVTGESKELTEWHRVVLFGKSAELAQQYLSKGSMVYIEGKIRTRKWQDDQGKDRYTTEIIATSMQFLGGSNKENNAQQPLEQQSAPSFAKEPVPFDNQFQDDDIPF